MNTIIWGIQWGYLTIQEFYFLSFKDEKKMFSKYTQKKDKESQTFARKPDDMGHWYKVREGGNRMVAKSFLWLSQYLQQPEQLLIPQTKHWQYKNKCRGKPNDGNRPTYLTKEAQSYPNTNRSEIEVKIVKVEEKNPTYCFLLWLNAKTIMICKGSAEHWTVQTQKEDGGDF